MSAFMIAARRSPVAPRGGALAQLEPHELGEDVVRACLSDAGLEGADVDELIVGNALGAGGNPARILALAAGLPRHIGGLSIDRQCVSGLDAILLAKAMVESGHAKAVLAGGVESYSRRPLRLRTDPDGGANIAYDQPPFTPWPDRDPLMADAADALGRHLGISRQEADEWAAESHAKARVARDQIRAELVVRPELDRDAYTRNLSPRTCQKARPISGSVTVANTAVAADGAAFCLVVSEDIAKRAKGPALKIAAGVTLGADPLLPGLAPVAAISKVLEQERINAGALSVSEIMEAFAVQAIACVREAGLNPDQVNPGGGALARGHPIGASGAILAVRLYHELTRRGGVGLAAIAAAGGLGTAFILRN